MVFHLPYNYALGAIFAVFSVAVLVGLFLKRHNNFIIARNATLLLIQGAGYAIIVVTIFFYAGLRNDFNCSVSIFFQWLVFPLIIQPFVFRCWEYCASFHVASSRTKFDTKRILGDLEENELPPPTETEDYRLKSWFIRHKKAGSASYLVKVFLWSVWVVILPVVPIIINGELDNNFEKYDYSVYGCNTFPYFIILLAVGAAFSIISMVILAIILRHSQDAFHIRHEIIGLAVWWIVAAPPLLIYSVLQIVDKYFPPATFMALCFVVAFCINMVCPLYWAWQDDRSKARMAHSNNAFDSFVEKLTLPVFRNDFFQFLSLQFCAENLLFYEVVTEWKAKVEHKSINEDERTVIGNSIYNNFIADSGEFQINISSAPRNKIKQGIASEQFGTDVFDGAIKEVVELMFVNSYHNYVRTVSPNSAMGNVILRDSVA